MRFFLRVDALKFAAELMCYPLSHSVCTMKRYGEESEDVKTFFHWIQTQHSVCSCSHEALPRSWPVLRRSVYLGTPRYTQTNIASGYITSSCSARSLAFAIHLHFSPSIHTVVVSKGNPKIIKTKKTQEPQAFAPNRTGSGKGGEEEGSIPKESPGSE
ncbi:hypothetical protein BKA81DRAFT_148352 [Phyllosticta paracitricarpa]